MIKKLLSPLRIQQIITILIFSGLLLSIAIFPNNLQEYAGGFIYSILLLILMVLLIVELYITKNPQKISDIFLVIAILFVLWEVITRFALIDIVVFPPPVKVFAVYFTDYLEILLGIANSLLVLGSGYILAIIIAIPLGLLVGWNKRLYDLSYPISKGLSPVPPMVYIPYAIILLPSFFLSSVFVIFVGSFWPIFLGVITGVFNIDSKIINSAKTLGLSDKTMLTKILLPGAMPHIFSGAFIGLIIGVITLLIAEVIGSSVGIGWYLQHQSQFANYDAILAGMIVISIMVIIITTLFDKVQNHVLRWQ
ncbi:ABC transporter permease [Methanobrevibacter filiformis]|uniref:Putative aliphatic sulfonates transport permease protein SsuC n=1 Tax=Methanobrevibacter filiformis TaxID=55758 RepID=A0A166AF88_9EURY|nr:ABC transporter permease subunit [Methanobrevibacter filiformis]KZX11954.1 putative aliphatic sulfonates transport permease protein SsuC [Methanobrevibacter filiformis]